MGRYKSRGWWRIELFRLLFGFGLMSVVTLAWLGNGRSPSRFTTGHGAGEDNTNHRIMHTFDDGGDPVAPDELASMPVRADDRRLRSLRRAADLWRRSEGPRRRVIDQVCLVADLPAFLEAIAAWDERHFFPILIDDPAWTLPFLRAFRPAHVMRYDHGRSNLSTEPGESGSLSTTADHEAVWREALLAVARAWTGPASTDADLPPGGRPPRWLGPTPPGAVLASSRGPMLAGAVALAAGRFQPLVRLEPDNWPLNDQGIPSGPRHFGDVLTLTEAWHFARRVQAQIEPLFAHYDRLGDECDFLTLAGDWPYRFNNASGPTPVRGHFALDDLIGRTLRRGPQGDWLFLSRRRWAYTGRLLGGPAASVARAMAALFLKPSSALLWNTYGGGKPWSEYTMEPAVERLRRTVPGPDAITLRQGKQADLATWHHTIDPSNRFGLMLINSSGGPQYFAITGGPGRASDLPAGIPVAVSMIHSFSAADPTDPQTIAGRWLDQGAFAYFGSMNEPYVDAFRRPQLVAELIDAEVPLVAALRQGESETFGHPWRLVYLGDPLYRIKLARTEESETGHPVGERLCAQDWRKLAPAYADWNVVEVTATSTGEYRSSATPSFDTEEARLGWCLDAAIGHLTANDEGRDPRQRSDWRSVLRQIRRDRLDPKLRSFFDDLVIDTLRETGDLLELSARLARIPAGERGPRVWQALEHSATVRMARLIQDQEPTKVFGWTLPIWDEVMRQPWPAGSAFPEQITERIAALAAADARRRLRPWHDRLRQTGDALKARPSQFPHVKVIAAELARVEARLGGDG